MTKKPMANPRDAYGTTLVTLGEKYPQVVVLDADLSKSTKTILFAKKFPDRFFEMGIAEANMISTAAGLASCGKIPFASTFAVFATGRVYDQIRMDVAYSEANVKIFATHAGISVGKDGASHQMIEDLALMRVLPNMTVLAPSDAPQTQVLVECMATTTGPMYARVGRANAPIIYAPDDLTDIRIGRGLVARDGSDISIIACGTMVDQALEAYAKLKALGVSARVVDMHTIKPLDEELIVDCGKSTNGILTVEEHSVIGGLGSAVAEVLVDSGISVPFHRIGVRDTFCESGEPEELLDKYELSAPFIVAAAQRLLKGAKAVRA